MKTPEAGSCSEAKPVGTYRGKSEGQVSTDPISNEVQTKFRSCKLEKSEVNEWDGREREVEYWEWYQPNEKRAVVGDAMEQ